MYRDVSNNKLIWSEIIEGEFRLEEIEDCLEDGAFIPSQVLLGNLQLRWDNFPDQQDDHVWHEWLPDGFEFTEEEPTCVLTAKRLIEAFKEAKGNWKVKETMEGLGLIF